MAIHEELKPDDAALPYLMARANRLMSTDISARTAGTIVVPNLDGTDTVLGTNGVAPWVGDTTPPGRPLDIEATSHLGTALIRWGGELEGGMPDDFRCVQVMAKPVGDADAVPVVAGVLSSAGEVNTGVFPAGTTLDVWAVAYDNAHDRDGSPAYNESVESEHMQVEILPIVSQQEFDEAADNILAAADESVKAQIERVDADLAAANEAINKKAEETLEAAKADTAKHVEQVNKDIEAANKLIAANTSAVETEAQLRAEGDRQAQQATQAVKAETDKLKDDYAGMATDVANVQASVVEAVTKADTALTTANGKNRRYVQPAAPVDTSVLVQGDEWWQTSSKPLETYWTGEPNNSTSVLVDHSNEVEHVFVWDGSRWNEQVLSAEHLLVPGTISAGLVSAEFFDGAVVKGGAFLTSNERIQLNNAGLVMTGKSGETLVSMNATDGTATFNDVSIINGTLTAPVLEGGTINGGSFNLKDTSGKVIGQFNTNGISFGDKLTFSKQNNEWVLNLKGALKSGSTITGASVTGGTVQTVADKNRGIKLTGGNLDIYSDDKSRFLRANENGLYISDENGKPVLAFARTLRTYWTGEPNNSTSVLVDGWQLTLDGAIQSGGEISGAAITGSVIRTNTEWQSSEAAKRYRGLVITDGGMFAYKNNGAEEYSMAFTADDGTLRLDGSVMANGSLTLPTITGGEVIGSNIRTGTDADNRAEMDANGFRVVSNGETVIAFDVNGTVDVGTSGLASADDVSNLDERLSADIGELDKAVQNQQGTLEDEITQRRKYLRFDSSTGLEIGEQATGDVAGCTLRLTPTRMEFRQGDVVAAYVSNDRLNINNAEIINTLTIGKFAFLPRDSGHLSLQYIG